MPGLIKFIDRFDSQNPRNQSLGRFIGVFGAILFISIAIAFCYTALHKSLYKNFWTDETFGLTYTIRKHSLANLLVLGAQGQGSPAPLDYIFIKVLDHLRGLLHLEWIPFNIYYRLNSLFWTFWAGLGVTFLFFNNFRLKVSNHLILLLQIVLLAFSLGYFYFRHDNLYYAMETRPYALWNSFWFCFMALFLFYREFNWQLLTVGIVLALTSSGSLYQLSIFLLIRFFYQYHETKDLLPTLQKVFWEFSLPVIISIYYTMKGEHYGYCVDVNSYHMYLNNFMIFWEHKARVAIISFVGFLLTFINKKWRKCSVVFLTILLLYILSPICNYLILSKGLFFSSRQYLYYDLTVCIFTIGLTLMLPDYWERIKGYYLPPASK